MTPLIKLFVLCLILFWLIVTTGLLFSLAYRIALKQYTSNEIFWEIVMIILWPLLLVIELLGKIFGG